MTKSFDFAKLFKLVALAALAITVIGALLLVILGGDTFIAYRDGNLGFVFYLKALITVILSCVLVTLYFGLRFRKKHGFKAGLIASLSACVSALTSFFICVIFRAPLCGYVFSVILLAICISFMCSVVHFDFLNGASRKKGNKEEDTSPSARGFRRLLLFLFVILVILFVAFIAALLMDATLLTFYAFPACVTVVFSSIFTFSACGKLFKN
ncbi:MAG: hypothetical protein IKK10_05710 [Clostridia bacterium]|nr:hypothetical protein [Clostridia bacterium]